MKPETIQAIVDYDENGPISIKMWFKDSGLGHKFRGKEAVSLITMMLERLAVDFGVDFASFTKEALTAEQIMKWNLPVAPAKATDTRTKGFTDKYGAGVQVELDAIKPDELRRLIDDSISRHFDFGIRRDQERSQEESREQIRGMLKGLGDIECLLDKEGA